MTGEQFTVENPEAAALFDMYRRGIALDEALQEATATGERDLANNARDHIDTFVKTVIDDFIGRSVLVTPIDIADQPIGAYYDDHFGTHRLRSNGVFVKSHPKQASGMISPEIGPWTSITAKRLDLKPRRFSRYWFDRGFFSINVLDEQNQPLVDVTFLD